MKFSLTVQDEFVRLIRAGEAETLTDACRRVGVSYGTYVNRRRADGTFAARVDDAFKLRRRPAEAPEPRGWADRLDAYVRRLEDQREALDQFVRALRKINISSPLVYTDLPEPPPPQK